MSTSYDEMIESLYPTTTQTYDEFETTQEPLVVTPWTEEERKAFTPTPKEEKLATLEKRKAEILKKHLPEDQFSSLSKSYTVLEDGRVESNTNKLWGARDMSGAQFNSIFDEVKATELTTDDKGNHYLPSGEVYQGPVERIYNYGTKDSDTAAKFGVSRGDKDTSDVRYTNYKTGPSGVDISKKHFDMLVPSYIAKAWEGIGHARQEALDNRLVPEVLDKEEARKYGSGASEYYKSREAFLGDPSSETYGTPYTPEEARDVLYQYASLISDPFYKGNYSDEKYLDAYYSRLAEQATQDRFDNQTAFDEATQTLSALPAGAAKGFIDLVDAAQEAITYVPQLVARAVTGDTNLDIDLFDDGFKKAVIGFTDELVGYDRKMDDVLMQRVMSDVQAADIDITSWESIKEALGNPEKRAKLGNATLAALLDPSFSASMLSEIVGSGLGYGSIAKGGLKVVSKVAPTAEKVIRKALQTNLSAIKTEMAATKDAAKIAELEKSYTFTKKLPDFLKGTTYTNADMMVRMNNDITAFKESNKGEGPDAAKLLQIAILDRVASNMEVMSLKSLVGINDIAPAVAKVAVKKGIVRAAGDTAAHLLKDGLMEGSQEAFDTIVEQLNQKVGAADFKDKSISKVISEASSEILTSTIAGGVSGVHVGTVGLAPGTVNKVAQGTATVLGAVGKALGGKEGTSEPIPETEESNAQIAAITAANTQRATTSTNPTAAYFSSFGSDSPEVRVAAQQKAQQAKKELFDGTHTVFSSDITPEEQINQLKALATIVGAEDGSIGSVEELSAAVLAKVKPATAEQEASLVQELEKAYKVGQQFASIKPMAEVAGEVSDGARGFLTYAAQAYAAMSEGDEDTLQKSLENLDRFYAHQETKLNRLTAGITEAKAAATAKAEMLVQNGTAKTFSDAITLLRKKAAKNPENGKTVFFNDQKTGSVVIPDVEIYRALENTGYEKEVANRGTKIFGIVKQVQNEVTAMKDVYSSLLGEQDVTPATVPAENVTSTEGTAPIEATIPSSNEDTTLPAEKERVKALADKLATRTPETKFTAQELQDLTNNAAEIETLLKNRMESQETDVPSMEDTGEFTVSATDREDGVTTDVVPKEFEGAPISEENGTEVAFEEAPAPEEDDIEAISEEEFNAFEEDTSGVTNQFEEMPMPEENDYTAAALSENDYTETVPEEFTGEEVDEHGVSTPTAAKKDSKVQEFITNRKAIKAVKQQIREARAALSREGITTKSEQDTDAELKQLLDDEKELTEARNGAFKNVVSEVFKDQVAKFAKLGKKVIVYLATPYINGEAQKPLESTIEDLVDAFVPTGFTLSYRSVDDVLDSTKDFASKLKKALGKDIDLNNHENYKQNPLLAFVFNADGEINYNVVEALQAAVYDFVVQDATNLLSGYRTDEEIAKILGMSEESIPAALYATLREGGVTLRLASASVGEKVLQNLGMQVDNVQAREALVTSFGIVALQGAVGTLIEDQAYTITKKDKQNGLKGNENSQIRFIVGKSNLFGSLGKVQKDIKNFEERLGVELEKERTYRKERKKGKENILIHRTSFQEAPKDHQDVVHRLENTAFSINSGHSVLLEMFSKDGKLDVDALVVHILGDPASATNFDAKKRYKAQKAALIRSITFYQEAADDTNTGTGYGDIFFNWFIAKNHRIHLDSNRVNPQNDKHLARWLLTTKNSHKDVSRKLIDDVLKGDSTDLTATAFLYSIVQAFDDVDGIPGIDKDSKSEVLVAAKMLLSKDRDELIEMAKQAKLLGHATLAIANIDKYNSISSADSFSSDMVLEVDGLTNGFAFRALQYPVKTEGSGISPTQWLEKVGVIFSDSELYAMESMSQARGKGQEDVYTSVGRVFQEAVINMMKSTKDANAKKWFALLGSIAGGIPDFSDVKNKSVEKFMRNLMKSPVMTFNYAAGANKIATSLVENHIMGTDYLSSKGIIDLLTAKEAEGKNKGEYKVTEQQLQEAFGKELGTKYHKARVALDDNSLKSVGNTEIATLRRDLTRAIGILYTEPLETTLEGLFAKQTEINSALASAAQFMFDYFKTQYSSWRSANPEANDADKIEYLRNIAAIVPGVAGASSDDQTNKIIFLKNMLEATNTDVKVGFQGRSPLATNTVSRGYNDPGVGPAVLTILSLDSSVMARTLNKSFSDSTHGALPIHDAIALGIGEFETITNYNQEFYATNRGYSVIQSFVNAIEELSTKDGMIGKVAMVGAKKDTPIVFELMKSTLERLNEEVNQARQELFSKDVKVGQLVGMEGTMAHINVKEEQELAKQYLEKVKNEIFGVLKSKKVVESLSKGRYNDIINHISTLLEGCK